MTQYEKSIIVTTCIYACDFYSSTMDGMECGHPYFNNKSAYSRLIIDHTGKIPKKCPLRKEDLAINRRYSLQL